MEGFSGDILGFKYQVWAEELDGSLEGSWYYSWRDVLLLYHWHRDVG